MKENISIEQAKYIMSQINIIIYGTIRDIENHFLKSFSNLDILTTYFNQIYIIILENDSKDRTRNYLVNWHKSNSSYNVKKHIILLDHLDEKYPLRAHRLAYCRNMILDYISHHHLENEYSYAIHCDLDDRFWSIDFNSIVNCFQYDSAQWDMMSCINKNYQYYDWWALRCEQTWFNKNIFSCEGKHPIEDTQKNKFFYDTKVNEFIEYLTKHSLISVNSSFNGFGIYKLSSMINCRYSAHYYCPHCHNKEEGCKEDNDHIGLHRLMIEKGCKLFINTKMILTSMPKSAVPYNDFILSIKNKIPVLDKNPLTYILMKNMVSLNGPWLYFGMTDGEKINQISKYNENNLSVFKDFKETTHLFKRNKRQTVYTYDKFEIEIKPFTNKNVQFFLGDTREHLSTLKKNLSKNDFISFIFIDCLCYQSTKDILYSLFNKIKENTIIVFHEFANYKNYFLHELKAFYEFVNEFNIKYEFIGMKDAFQMKILHHITFETPTLGGGLSDKCNAFSAFEMRKGVKEDEALDKSIAIRIMDVPIISKERKINTVSHKKKQPLSPIEYTNEKKENKQRIDDFNWKFYITQYPDLNHIQTEEEALDHWIHYGFNESRICKPNLPDLPQIYKNESIDIVNHTIHPDFDWSFYVSYYQDLNNIQTQKEAWDHWVYYGSKEGRIYKANNIELSQENTMGTIIDPEFDWEYYINKYDDLASINTKEEAWYHWTHYGINEGRNYDGFDWYLYLKLNPELIEHGIKTKENATSHWFYYGKKEGRKCK